MVRRLPSRSRCGYIKPLIFFWLTAVSGDCAAQCCSSGSPTGSAAFAGLVKEKNVRVYTFGRYAVSDHYYEGGTRLDDFGIFKKAENTFTGLSLGWGITRRITAEAEWGYFVRKNHEFRNEQLGSLVFSGFSTHTFSENTVLSFPTLQGRKLRWGRESATRSAACR